jgi:hypothetical protein
MSIGGVFKKALPFLSAAIPGGGVVAKMAFDAIGKALGTKPPESAEEAEAALKSATPEQLLALQSEEHNFKLQMETLQIKSIEELERISAGDRDSARNREIKIRDNTPRVLAYVYATGFFITLAAHIAFMTYIVVDHIQLDTAILALILTPVSTLEGVLIGMVLGSKEYYFGSSAGSKGKDDTIARLSE